MHGTCSGAFASSRQQLQSAFPRPFWCQSSAYVARSIWRCPYPLPNMPFRFLNDFSVIKSSNRDSVTYPSFQHTAILWANLRHSMDERECDSSLSFSSSSSSSDSSSSDDYVDSSSGSNNSSWNNIAGSHEGPLYHMNALLRTLPCKRGLSSFFEGKSQSFSCLADVKCVEELSKDLYYRRKKLKSSHSCGSRLNINDKNGSSYEPRISSASLISKRPQKASKMMMSKKAMNFVMSSRPPLSLPLSLPKHAS